MIVVSDMIGTLTTGSPVRGLVDWVKNNQSSNRATLYLLSILPSYALVLAGLLDAQRWGQRLMKSSLKLVRNATPATLKEIGAWSVDKELWPGKREDVLDRIQHHKNEGADVYLVSSAFEPTVADFASRIHVSPIGSPVEIANGRVRFSEGLNVSRGKVERLHNSLGVDHFDFAYGDTWSDIPMLEHSDHPVAVYPDKALRAMAMERGWEVVGG
jgi:HAD superfamily phosphoserine phosphatase-like hydrolase